VLIMMSTGRSTHLEAALDVGIAAMRRSEPPIKCGDARTQRMGEETHR
jgi:hypothetical protein